MRLDHLLSKEHRSHPPARSWWWVWVASWCTRVWCPGLLVGGTSRNCRCTVGAAVSGRVRPRAPVCLDPCCGGGLGGVWWWGKAGAVVSGCGASTLLGPEGSDPVTPRAPVWWWGVGLGFSVAGALVPWVIPVHGHHVVRGGCGCVVIVSVWVAGCWLRTVQWTRASVSLLLFVKFLRAHGGCLGTRNRRRT